MASYHFAVKIIKRSQDGNVIAAAAYRAGTRLRDEKTGRVYDYSNKRGVAHAEIMAPEGSAAWLRDRQSLWAGVDRMETRVDSQLAREVTLAIPFELTPEERLGLLRSFIRDEFVVLGMVADFAIHEPIAERGDDLRNIHAHILLSQRKATADGLFHVKTREWNSDQYVVRWRARWAEAQNLALTRAGRAERVDHRSLAVQRSEARERGDTARAAVLDRRPETHVGPKARALAAREGYDPPRKERVVSTARPRGGVWYSSPERAKRTRLVRYPTIDTGPRYRWNLVRVSSNAERLARRRERHELWAARVRDIAIRDARRAHQSRFPETRRGKGRPVRQNHAQTLLEALEALIGALLGYERHHHQRRRRLSNFLLRKRSSSRGRGRSSF